MFNRTIGKSFLFIFFTFLLSVFCMYSSPVYAGAQLVAVGDEGAIILRWTWPKGDIFAPEYRIYQKDTEKAQWRLLTIEPITKTKDREKAKEILGDNFEKYKSILFPAIPSPKDEPAKFREAMQHKDELWGITMLSADMHPELADLLGVRYVDRTVDKGHMYIYRLVMIEKGEEKTVGISLPMEPKKPAISPPKGFIGKAGDGLALLKWEREKLFSAYDVYRQTGPKGKPTKKVNKAPIVIVETFDKEGAARTPEWLYVDRNLQNGTTYTYTLKGRDPFGRFSPPSESIEITPVDLTPPFPPKKLSTEVRNDIVTLTWEKSPDEDLAGYNLYRSLNYKTGFGKIAENLSADTLKYVDRGLKLGQSYWYHLTAIDTSGNESGPSYTALANVVDRIPPADPKELKGKAEPGKILLSWTPNKEEDLAGYRVFRSMNKNATHYQLLNQEPFKEASFVNEVPKTASTIPFFLKVKAVDTSGNESGFSNVVKVKLPDVTPPITPIFRTYKVEEGTIQVSWYPNTESDVAGYRLYRTKAGDESGKQVKLNKALIPKDERSFTDEGLEAGQKYAYVLQAVDTSKNVSLPSRPLVASTFDKTPPPAPEGLRAAPLKDGKGIILTWKMPKAKDLKGVVLYRARKENGTFYPITGLIKQKSHVDAKVRKAREYYYRLVAFDGSNNKSDYSRSVKVMLKPQ